MIARTRVHVRSIFGCEGDVISIIRVDYNTISGLLTKMLPLGNYSGHVQGISFSHNLEGFLHYLSL